MEGDWDFFSFFGEMSSQAKSIGWVCFYTFAYVKGVQGLSSLDMCKMKQPLPLGAVRLAFFLPLYTLRIAWV